MKNSIAEWDSGSLLWGIIIALVVLIAAVAAAVKFLPRPMTPEPAPVVARAKVPQMPPPTTVGAPPGQEPATSATAAAEIKSANANATASPAVPPTGDKIKTVDLRKTDNEPASPATTLEAQKPGPSAPAIIGNEVKAPSIPAAAQATKIESSATPQPISATAGAAKSEPAAAKASTKSKATEEKKKEKNAAQIDLDKLAPFSIQVGAFRSKANADEIIAQLTQKGYAPFIFQVTDAQQRSFYMVRFGHFGTRDKAAQALTDFMRKQKRSAVIVRSESM